MSGTTRQSPRAEPGAADVTPMPKWIEHDEPGGANWDDPKRVTDHEVGIEAPAQIAVKALGAVDIRQQG